ncbi:TPA: tRNA 2-thiocytidine biosynthesis protein TtcA [Candidatus Avacholeplasma faecigallinarum]|nr:tRNA 2-thiocytidine biosynthesis protein TtcA [Candidatus Avacholeplasma faecigallinarum]
MEKYKEIERSIITTYRGKLWSKFIKAIKEYQLIKPNDKICVCMSGGKDSFVMAKLFQELKRHSDFEFEVEYLVMNPGYNQKNLDVIKNNLELMKIDAVIKDTDIFEIANLQEKSPCYLCAKMRRGALYKLAKELGCNKIALGHHFDDVIETTLMNMLNVGSFQTMLPKLHSQNYEKMELIRPLYYIREKDIINWKNYNGLEFIACACKLTENILKENITSSQRLNTKILIKELTKYNPFVEKNIFKSTTNVYIDKILGYKKDGQNISFLDNYDKDDIKTE